MPGRNLDIRRVVQMKKSIGFSLGGFLILSGMVYKAKSRQRAKAFFHDSLLGKYLCLKKNPHPTQTVFLVTEENDFNEITKAFQRGDIRFASKAEIEESRKIAAI
jgi:hypothetical protein